ncbi:MAG: hypothetical protein GX868_14655 [Actinobacteria bacterium]|nr:hypothetical protein [Actinomycetota bacterium]
MSIRHPIVRAAAEYFGGLPAAVWRFASVSLPEADAPDEDCLVGLYLVTTTGIRPRLEIWPFATTIATGKVIGGVGEALLSAVASGSLGDGGSSSFGSLTVAREAIEEAMYRREEAERARATRDNRAEVSRQISIQRAKVQADRRKREELLTNPSLDGSMQRLHLGAIRNAQDRLEEVVNDLERKRGLTMMSELLAFAVVAGRSSEEVTR